MKKKDKVKRNKKDSAANEIASEAQRSTQHLEQRITELEQALLERDNTIKDLTAQLKGSTVKKTKPGKKPPPPVFKQYDEHVGVDQKRAWKRHAFLLDRYEFHLTQGILKRHARLLADKDLRGEFGEEAGFDEQVLAEILT